MANEAYNYYEYNAICNMMITGDGSHNTYKFTLSSDLIGSVFGGNAPNLAFASVIQDSTGLGLSATASVATALGITTCTVTFNHNIPTSDPINGPYIQIQITFEYASE